MRHSILHTCARVGSAKVGNYAGAQPLGKGRRPRGQTRHWLRVEQLLEGYDLVVDGSDNFPARYLVNDACLT